MKRTTISDIARECGVSLSTVSLVLNNSPRISAKTRARVLAAVEKFGYQPNMQARALASRSSRMVSVVVPHLRHVFADIYFGEIVSGIYDYASEHDYKVMLDVANRKFVQNREYLNILKTRRVDGMLFIASSMEDTYLKDFDGRKDAFLLVNHYYPDTDLNYIMIDYKDSARQAAEHLTGLGHCRIGLIAGVNTYTGRDFRDAFIAACTCRGCREKDIVVTEGGRDWSQEDGFRAAEKLLSESQSITAIMAANDRMAIGAMRYVHTHGLKVPEDISIMGVDDIPDARFTTPGLTTVHHPLYTLGRRACEVVLQLFRGELDAGRELIAGALSKRESTAPPRDMR